MPERATEGMSTQEPAAAPQPHGAAPGPEGLAGPAGLETLRNAPETVRAARVHALQRSAGNAALARLLTGAPSVLVARDPPAAAPAAPAAGGGGTLHDEVQQAVDAWASGPALDFVDAHRDELPRVSEDDRMALVRKIHTRLWVDPIAEYALEAIWNSFGADVLAVAGRHADLWTASMGYGAELEDIDAVARVRADFQRDVLQVAAGHMLHNRQATEQEMQRFGFPLDASLDPSGAESPTAALEQNMHLRAIRAQMQQVDDAQQAQAALRGLHVGYRLQNRHTGPGEWESDIVPAHFEPGAPPMEPMHGTEGVGWKPHAEVQAMWDRTQAWIAAMEATSPAIMAAVTQGQVHDIASAASPEAARAQIQPMLERLRADIQTTDQRIQGGDIDYRSLAPIHQQLYAGQAPALSGTRWQDPIAQSIAKAVVDDHEAMRMWLQTAAGLVAGGLFIAAEFATAGMATFALAGAGALVSAGVAAESWQNYTQLRTAADSAADPSHRVVDAEQAQAALWEAVLNTVFAVLDVASPAWRLGRAAMIGIEGAEAARALEAQIPRLAELMASQATRGDAGRLVERLVAEYGVQGAIQRTGKTAEELMAVLAEDSPIRARLGRAGELGAATAAEGGVPDAAEAARREALVNRAGAGVDRDAARAWLGAGDLRSRIRGLVDAMNHGILDGPMADQLVTEAVERYGPRQVIDDAGGWRALSNALTNDSPAGALFVQWRAGIYNDLKAFAHERFGIDIPDQGSVGRFKNDLDISIPGALGAHQREEVAVFLAGRLGSGNSPGEFNRLLMMEIFTDPARLHAFDALPAEVRSAVARRQAEYERELIPNRDLYQALQAHDDTLAEAIRAQMREQGVREFAYRPLSGGELREAALHLDELHQVLAGSTDAAAREQAARELGETQALINAADDGGYFSGGGARRWVTQRETDSSKWLAPIVPGAERTATAGERFTNLLDQVSKLNHAAQELAEATTRDDLVEAIRAIGKYGERARLADTVVADTERAAAAARQAGEGAMLPETDALIQRCQAAKAYADGRELSAAVLRDMDGFRAAARQLLDEVRGESMTLLADLRAEAGLRDVPGGAQLIVDAVQSHAQLSLLASRVESMIAAFGTTAGRAARASSAPAPGAAPVPAP